MHRSKGYQSSLQYGAFKQTLKYDDMNNGPFGNQALFSHFNTGLSHWFMLIFFILSKIDFIMFDINQGTKIKQNLKVSFS